MPGLEPGIHAAATQPSKCEGPTPHVDGQDEPGHDGQGSGPSPTAGRGLSSSLSVSRRERRTGDKGHAAQIEYAAADRIFVGHIAGINDVVGFHGDAMDVAEQAFHEAVEDYTATCATVGEERERAYSGNVVSRCRRRYMPTALAAHLAGKSLN